MLLAQLKLQRYSVERYQYGHGEFFPDILECADILPRHIRDSGKSFSLGWRLNYQQRSLRREYQKNLHQERTANDNAGFCTLTCLDWLWPSKCLLYETPSAGSFGLLASRNTWCGNAWFGEQVRSKYGTWCGGSSCNYLFELAFVLASFRFAGHTVLTSPNKDETAVHGYGPSLSVLVVLVSPQVSWAEQGHKWTGVGLPEAIE